MTSKKTNNKVADEEPKHKFSGRYFEAVGRRKKAVARVRIYNDKKRRVIVNDQEYQNYFPFFELRQVVEDPLKVTDQKDLSIRVKVTGGGLRGQAEAVQLAISRALLKIDKDWRLLFKPLGFLSRDSRRKERKKPGLKRARRAPQWSKR